MGFKKGHPGFKKKGTKNKINTGVEEKAAALGIDPIEILMKFAAGDWKGLGYENECYFAEKPDGAVKMGYVISPEMRMKAASEVAQYISPKKKAMEISGAAGVIRVVIEDYTKK